MSDATTSPAEPEKPVTGETAASTPTPAAPSTTPPAPAPTQTAATVPTAPVTPAPVAQPAAEPAPTPTPVPAAPAPPSPAPAAATSQEPVPTAAVVVPTEVSLAQARAVLLQVPGRARGRTLYQDVVDGLFAVRNTPEGAAAWLAWEYATVLERTSPLVLAIASRSNLDDAAVDRLFVAAAAINF